MFDQPYRRLSIGSATGKGGFYAERKYKNYRTLYAVVTGR
jgi:hypothetical protein